MKAITPVIGVILLVMITIAIIGFFFAWFSGLIPGMLGQTEEHGTQQQRIIATEIELVAVMEENERVSAMVRNRGSVSILENVLVITVKDSSGGITTYSYSSGIDTGSLATIDTEIDCPEGEIITVEVDVYGKKASMSLACTGAVATTTTTIPGTTTTIPGTTTTSTTTTTIPSGLSISFVTPPTDENGTIVDRDWTEVNVSVTSDYDTSSFINWNKSLVGYWNFNEGSGETANDNSTYGNDGTLNDPQWVTGKFGSALSFDGINDYVDCGDDISLDITDTITLEAWVKLDNLTDNDNRLINRYIWVSDIDNQGYYLKVSKNGNVVMGLFDDGMHGIASASKIEAGEWYHLVGIHDGAYLKIYINGQLDKSVENTAGAASATTSLRIGAGWNQTPNGTIDEVRIWNRALSEEEINASYNTSTYSLSRQFTDLSDGDYEYYAYTTNTTGDSAQTETRTLTVDTTWIYQEDADSTACNGDWAIVQSCSNTYDGDWSSHGMGNIEGYVYINYSKPANSLDTSLWQVSYDYAEHSTTENITINSNCWQQNPLRFKVTSRHNGLDCDDRVTYGYCWNGGGWYQLFFSQASDNCYKGTFYEEAIWWDIS